jgi:hypothetical protein
MGTFADTANADYWKQTSVFRFRLQETNGNLPLPFSVCSEQTEIVVFR